MKRHTIFCLSLNEKTINNEIDLELNRGLSKFGKYNSAHELYAVLKEEVEEFWESIKKNDVDPYELLQICAVAKRGVLQLCEESRNEIQRNKRI